MCCQATALSSALGLFALIIDAHSSPADAQAVWNASSGSWSTGANWTPTGAPVSGTTATINNGGTANVDAPGAQSGDAEIDDGSSVIVTPGNDWTVSSALNTTLTIGNSGAGHLTIDANAIVNVTSVAGPPSIYVGSNSTSTDGIGTLTVNGGSLNDGSGTLLVGREGASTGSVTIESGGQVITTGGGQIGDAPSDSTGTVTITGQDSRWDMGSGNFTLNNSGNTTGLTVSDGGSMTSGSGVIGGTVAGAGNNAVVVTGTGSSWQTGLIQIGDDADDGTGTGTLAISNQGHVTSSQVEIGFTPDGGFGTTDGVIVSGSGSQLSSTGSVFVGTFGTGDLMISDGATVTDVTGIVALSSTGAASQLFSTPTNSFGSALVTGAGSLWQNTNLIIGDNSSSVAPGAGTGRSVGALTVADGGEVSSTNAISVAANIGATGTINIGAAAGLAAAAPGTLATPAIMFGAGDGSIVFNHTSTNYTFDIPIEGAGSVDVENGTTVFTGANTYTGATTINGGTLEVNGSIIGSSRVTVNAGGTLEGAGTVGSNVTINGGTLAPGAPPVAGGPLVGSFTVPVTGPLGSSNVTINAPGMAGMPEGTLSINGTLSFQSGSTYSIQISPAAASRTNVAGTAALGGNVSAVFNPGSYLTKTYTILTSTGLGGTTFLALQTTDLPAGFTAGLAYSDDDVFLDLSTGTSSLSKSLGGGFPRNQQNVADAVQKFFNNGGALPPKFASLFGLSGGALRTALSQTSGEAAAGAQNSAFRLTDQFLTLMLNPFVDGRNDSNPPPAPAETTSGAALAYSADAQNLPLDLALAYTRVLKDGADITRYTAPRWSTWAMGYGGTTTTDGSTQLGTHGLSAQTYGAAAGVDYRISPDTFVGLSLGGGGLNWDLSDALGGGHSDAFQAGLYGKTQFGGVYVAGAFAFANYWMSTARSAFGGESLTANFGAQSYGGRLESGYRLPLPGVGPLPVAIAPYAAVQAQDFHTPAYRELGNAGGFGLAYNSADTTDTRTELGLRFETPITLDNGMGLTLHARTAWAHDFVSTPAAQAVFESLPGASFVVDGARPPQNSALVTTGAELHLTPAFSVLTKFDGEFAGNSDTYAGTATLRYMW